MSPLSDDQFAPRKVRCPNCKEVLTEPQGQIYECPNCLTLLLAKPSSRSSNRSKSSISRPPQNRGIESIQQAAQFDKERGTDDQAQHGEVSTETNHMEQTHASNISLDSNKEAVAEDLINKSDKGSPSEAGSEDLANKSDKGSPSEVCSEDLINKSDKGSPEAGTEDLINKSDKGSPSEAGSCFGVTSEADAGCSDEISENVMIEGSTTHMSLEEQVTSGSTNSDHRVGNNDGMDFDNDQTNGQKQILDEEPRMANEDKPVGRVKNLFDLSVFGIYDEKPYLEMQRGRDAHFSTLSEKESECFDNKAATEEHLNKMQFQSSPSEVDFSEHNKSENDVMSGVFDLLKNDTFDTIVTQAEYTNDSKSRPSPSEQDFPEHNKPDHSGVTDEDEVDKDAIVTSQESNGLDMAPQVSFGDWRSQQVVTAAKQKYSSVKDKRMLKTNLDAQSESSWDDDEDVTFPKPQKEQETNIRSQSTSSPEKHPLPLRTAAMQKFLQNAPKQGHAPKPLAVESQQMIYEAPYAYNYISGAPNTKLETREEADITLSENHLYETVNPKLVTNTACSATLDEPDTNYQKVVPGNKDHPSTTEELTGDVAHWNDKNVSNVEEHESEKGSINVENVERRDQTEMGKTKLEKEMTGRMETTAIRLSWKGKDVQRTTDRSPARHDRTQGMQLVIASDTEKDMIPVPGSEWNYNPNTNRKYNSRRTVPPKSKVEQSTDAQNRPIVVKQPGMAIHDLQPIGVPLDDDQYSMPQETFMSTRSNREPYGLPLPRNTGYGFTGSSHPGIAASHLPELIHNNSAHYCASPVRPVHQQQYHVHQQHMPPNVALHTYGSSASPSPRAGYEIIHHDAHRFPSNSRPVPKSQRQNRPKNYSQYPAVVPSKPKFYPPLPEKGAPPYVFCKGCNQILQLPSYIPPNTGPIQKLQCSNCRKISRFSVSLQASALSSWSSMRGSTVNNYKFTNSPSTNERGKVVGGVQTPYSYGPVPEAHKSVRNISAATSPHDFDVSIKEQLDHGNECRAMVSFGHDYARQASRSESDGHHSNGIIQSEGYLSSSPSSASGSSPWRNYHDTDFPRGELTLVSTAQRYPELDPVLHRETYSPQHPVLHRETYSPQRIYHGSFSESPYNRQLETYEQGFPAGSWQNEHASSDNYKNSPRSNNPDFMQTSAAPGSPLRSNFDAYQASNHRTTSSWSPSSGSPLFDHSSQAAGRESHRSASQHDVSKGPKYYAGLLKKGFKDLGKGGHRNSHRGKVYVNGQFIPEAAVRKAEEKAGVINPGEYWYDYEAGFWGAIDGPCLGIVMPNIEEFSIPMARDCAGGKTGILVNGRELHEKDLEVLAKRGLPAIPGKAYRVEINGKVFDESTGQQLKGLGKLAPSVEKKGCGFGMWQPSHGT